MKFEDALKAMREGKTVSKKGELFFIDYDDHAEGNVIINKYKDVKRVSAFCSTYLLQEDWEIVE